MNQSRDRLIHTFLIVHMPPPPDPPTPPRRVYPDNSRSPQPTSSTPRQRAPYNPRYLRTLRRRLPSRATRPSPGSAYNVHRPQPS